MSGWERRALWRAWPVLAVFILALNGVNVLSVLHDRAEIGRPLPVWEPVVWESTSGLCAIVFMIIGWQAIRIAPPGSRWLRFIGVHAAASLAFSVLHVTSMFALRALIYAAIGHRYGEGLASFPYEYRKDLIAYAIACAIFWLFRRLAAAHAECAPESPEASFDIRDGARLLRVPVGDIVCVASAGNYVEVSLADGRKPLMRATLASVEARLAPHGFVRTHRSWLVNSARLRRLDPEGSGDFTIELEGGLKAPLSRRFPAALDRLRAAG
jgi:DNA-binding LytR/AlgR family response regulator